MAVATLPQGRSFPGRRVAVLLLALLITLNGLNWSAVRDETAKNRCDTVFSTFYLSRCECMTHSLDFRDRCNSNYLPLVF
jgi:hypothetical protein